MEVKCKNQYEGNGFALYNGDSCELWSNPNDIVFTPFLGIGSEVYQALKMGRRGVGIELKESYYKQAVLNCSHSDTTIKRKKLFD